MLRSRTRLYGKVPDSYYKNADGVISRDKEEDGMAVKMYMEKAGSRADYDIRVVSDGGEAYR